MFSGHLERLALPSLLFALGTLAVTPSLSRASQQTSTTYGQPATFLDRTERGAMVHVEPGSRLWSRPDATGTSVIRVDAAIDLPVLERRPGWVKVRYAGHIGWLPALESNSEPASLAPSLRADPARLSRARQLIGPSRGPLRCGFLTMYTDVGDDGILARLSQIVAALPEAYAARYGLQPDGEAVEAIVLFRNRDDFVAFTRSETELARLRVAGFSRDGLAVVYAGSHTSDEVAHDLVHEVTHLLNRRVFGSALPPWLEEGMANDLGYSRIDSDGKLIPGSLSGAREESEVGRYEPGGWLSIDKHVRERGAVAALARLRDLAENGEMDEVGRLTRLTWQDFVAESGRQRRYDEATFLVRYLLDSRQPGLRRTFLQRLHALAGNATQRSDVIDPLSWPQGPAIGAGYRAWIVSTAATPD